MFEGGGYNFMWAPSHLEYGVKMSKGRLVIRRLDRQIIGNNGYSITIYNSKEFFED
jgi:hypothetical protein